MDSLPPDHLSAVMRALDATDLDGYAGLDAVSLVRACEVLARLESRIKAHRVAAARALDASQAASEVGATSTGALLASTFGGDPADAKRLLGQAKRLQGVGATERALGRGDVSVAQAELIAKTIATLPGEPTAEQRQACEQQLMGDAPELTLKDLARRADRISGVFAPDQVDVHEDKILHDRETAARKASYLWITDRKDGTYQGEFVIGEAHGAMLKNALNAINAPQVKKTESTSDAVLDEPPTFSQQMAEAFCTLIETIPADQLPDTAGVGAIMTVNLDYETLLGQIQPATLSDGTRISAGEARRMACNLRILPQVFNGASLPLDHGRAKRLFQTPQRRAAERRDRGCSFPGCDRPPSWCVGHHARQTWANGSGTDLADIVLICPHHHRVVHRDHWDIRFADDGTPEYLPPPTIDHQRQPRRNNRYRTNAA